MRAGAGYLLVLMVTGCGLSVGYNDNPPPVAGAEQLRDGSRVRIHSRSRGRVTGNLARVSADSIVILRTEEGGEELGFPAEAVSRVDIAAGRESRKGRGALIGLLAGGGAGFAVMLKICEDSCVGAWIVLAFPIGGALAGAGIGAIVGSQIKTERWRRVSWP